MATQRIIAYFITPHGFGHGSRATAVMQALQSKLLRVRFELFTTVPKPFFTIFLKETFGYHPVSSDVGVVQLSPLQEDLPATCDQLDLALPYDENRVRELAEKVRRLGATMVICDISPLGIAVARTAGLPSVLVENFTWDWIYENYAAEAPRFRPHVDYLAGVFRQADYHIQTPPLCRPSKHAIQVGPISRNGFSTRSEVRKRLGIAEEEKMVLLTMGGVPDTYDFFSALPPRLDWRLVIPGCDPMQFSHEDVITLPTHSTFPHPDLMKAADALVGKAGYSTIAEAYHAGIPFGYIGRPASPESAVLESFLKDEMPSLAIPNDAYARGDWIRHVPELLGIPRGRMQSENGADTVARYLLELLGQ